MASNIQTINEHNFVQLAKDVHVLHEVKTRVENEFDAAKKAIVNLVTPLFEESFDGDTRLVTNFKIPSGEVIEVDNEGETVYEVMEDGGLIQAVMKIPTSELDAELIPVAQGALGGHFKKLFAEEIIIDTVDDPAAFLQRASELPNMDKAFKLGSTGASIKVKDASFFDGHGVTLRTRTVNKTSFLSKINDLPQGAYESAQSFLQEYVGEHLSVTIQTGNRTESASK